MIGSCGVLTEVYLRPRPGSYRNAQAVYLKASVIVPANSYAIVEINALPELKQDFFFIPDEIEIVSLYTYIIDTKTNKVIVKNEFDYNIKLARNTRVSRIYKIKGDFGLYSDAFSIINTDPTLVEIAERPVRR